jgi:predicted ATP-dependent endonuclease of OLD family
MIAESSKSKEQNVFIQPLAQGDYEERLLHTALIYGANASGKSNLLRAVFDIQNFICGNKKPKAGEDIPAFDSFEFADETRNSPVEFMIEFAGKDNVKYKYELIFNKTKVLRETLVYFPNNKSVNLFTRNVPEDNNSNTHIGQLGSSLKGGVVEVLYNQPVLSKFGDDTPNQIITDVYIYLSKIEVINACSTRKITSLKNETSENLSVDTKLNRKMNELLKFADTGLNGVKITELSPDELRLPDNMSESVKWQIFLDYKYNISILHNDFKENQLVQVDRPLPYEEESNGTKTIYALGGKLMQILNEGGVIFVDELETSLHPFLSKLLVSMFQNQRINKKNAQLIFTTHDTNLLDRTIFRKDQIWFTEKNKFGATELYSLQDFNDVREDTPFDKWYLAGKFGGIPNIQSIESLFTEE